MLTIGLLWGDFPWDTPPPKVGKLLSSGVVGRNVARALRSLGTLVPYGGSSAESGEDAELVSFLRSIDLLWADLYPTSAHAVRLRHELNLPCRIILYAGGTLPKAAEAMLFPWQTFLRPGDNLLLTCEADLEIWHELVDWSGLREWVVPLPVDETAFYPGSAEDRVAIRGRYGLPVDVPLLLYVGRFNIQKNLHTLLHVLAGVRRRVPDTHLCLVGETDDIMLAEFGVSNEGYVERLRALAAELDVEGAVTFLEPLYGSDLAALYRAADVLVNASFYHRENFGLSAAEAQACGLPVVCSDWGGFRDVVRHGETGYVMDTVITRHGVRVDWASGVDYVTSLLLNEIRRREMGRQAVRWALERFALPAFTARLRPMLDAPDVDVREPDSLPYEPSEFVRRYEANKQASGWYESGGAGQPMFEGHAYTLYERMMQPYATRLGLDLSRSALQPVSVPYFPSPVRCGVDWATSFDPVWPQQRRVSPFEHEVLRRIDGSRTLAEIADELGEPIESPAAAMYRLYLEGLVLWSPTTVAP
jgi:glycosyltransferase involved in cell wall biosynthesis